VNLEILDSRALIYNDVVNAAALAGDSQSAGVLHKPPSQLCECTGRFHQQVKRPLSAGENFLYVFKPRPKRGARDGAASWQARTHGVGKPPWRTCTYGPSAARRKQGAVQVDRPSPLATDHLHGGGRRQPRYAPRSRHVVTSSSTTAGTRDGHLGGIGVSGLTPTTTAKCRPGSRGRGNCARNPAGCQQDQAVTGVPVHDVGAQMGHTSSKSAPQPRQTSATPVAGRSMVGTIAAGVGQVRSESGLQASSSALFFRTNALGAGHRD
jgi:hypothetical protein